MGSKFAFSIYSLACLLALCLSPVTSLELSRVEEHSLSRRLLQNGKKKKKEPKEQKHDVLTCNGPTMQLLEEHNMDTSFPNSKVKRLEGSDLVQVNDDYYVVFDNLYNIGRIGTNLSSADNYLLPHRAGVKGASGYEAIAYDRMTQQYFVVVETVPSPTPNLYQGMIEQIRIDDTTETTQYINRCATEFTFEFANKGFEGAAIVRANGGKLYMIALCEGNFCTGGNKGKERDNPRKKRRTIFWLGNGKMIIMQYHKASGRDACIWKTIREMQLPRMANFEDYSGMALRKTGVPGRYSMAVVSQQDSQLWLGQLFVGTQLDLSDWQVSTGSTYDFPRGPGCAPLFCSVEGVGFLHDNEFVTVSDVGGGTAPGCEAHDQSVHVFKLPGV